jgi:hypothetical protein
MSDTVFDKLDETAFPISIVARDGSSVYGVGMSLRDYFAAKVMASIMTGNWTKEDYSDEARRAYRAADAMLSERRKKPKLTQSSQAE